jgi:uncharacterized protein involved in outer membrane biogenesis
VALVFGLLLAGVTWGPNLMRDRIAAYVGETIGRELRIGRIEVSPFAGRVRLSDLTVASLDPGTPMLSLGHGTVQVDPLASLRGVVVVRGVELESPQVRIVRVAPDRFDFVDVIERFAGRPDSRRKTDWRVDRIAITDGTVTLDDRVVKATTTIDALKLVALGLTNQDALVDQASTLDASLRLGGHPVTIKARATPFAARPGGDADLRVAALPLALALPYLPLPADVRPMAGTVGIDARVAWRPNAPTSERLVAEGTFTLAGLSIHDAGGLERVAAAGIDVVVAPSAPLGGSVQVKSVRIRSPKLDAGRGADGRLEWPAAPDSATSGVVPTASDPGARRGPASLRIDAVTLDDARITWRDASLPAPLALQIEPLKIALQSIEVADLAAPTSVRGTGRLDATVDGAAALAVDLVLEGASGRANIDLSKVDLARYAPLAGPALKASIERGELAVRTGVAWTVEGRTWSIDGAAAEVTDLSIVHGGRAPATLTRLSIAGGRVDPGARRVDLDTMKLTSATLQVVRGKDGRINLQDWYVAPPSAQDPQPVTSSGTPAPAWAVRVGDADLAGLVLDYDDAAIPADRKLPKVTVNAKAQNLTLDPAQPIPFDAAVALADGSKLSARGTVRPTPLDLDARVRVQRFTVTHFEPYLAPYVNLSLASGQLWSSGRVQLSSAPDGSIARLGFDGEFSANDFRALDIVSSEEFLRWSALAMPSVKVDWRTGRPADSLIEIGAVAFVDFYARVILSPQGRLNLSDILIDGERGPSPRSITATPSGADAPRAAPAARTKDEERLSREVTYGTANDIAGRGQRAAARDADKTPGPTIRVGTVRIASGNVNFTDLFIRPNYTANLTQLVGSIDAIASDRIEPSDVLVSGRVDDDTPLEITGKVNPLAPTRFLDLRAVARGFDLPKLSPYSGRWAGYAIQKGKLTADVRYRIEGDTLAAENKLTINQLTFGDKIDSADATSLPVRLAVSLLKDRNGNIDLDLPIGGTISDPQFSVGGLLWRAIGNLILKVVSSPFTLLASLAGGGSEAGELSHIEFAAGASALDDEDRKRLDGLARALVSRPELSIDIGGVGDPAADRDAMQRERLERTLKRAKLAQMRRADPRAELPSIADLRLDDAERATLLEAAWREAKLDAGSGGKVPASDELERVLLEQAPIATEEVKQVAQARAQSARDYLRDTRGISNERLYLLAPRIAETGDPLPPRRADFTVK